MNPAPTPPDWDALRAEFPILHQRLNGHPLTYLDNAATSQKPRAVIDAMSRHLLHDNANVHRAVHHLATRSTQAFENARHTVAQLLNAPSPQNIIFTRGTTESINLLAHSFGPIHLQPGDEILITESEHHSNIVPWQKLARQTGSHLRALPIHAHTGLINPVDWNRWLTPRTKIFSFAHVSNVLGDARPISEWCAQARSRNVITVVDAAQSAGHLPLDVQTMDCDFLAFSGHKCCGPTGIGALYGRASILESMPPWQGGGEMIEKVTLEHSTFAPPPQRFEAGTPPITEAIGLAAAIDFLHSIGIHHIENRNRELTGQAYQGLRNIPGIRFLSNPECSTSLLSFVVEGVHAYDLTAYADMEGIALRAGHHCAQPLLKRFQVESAVRASVHFYNTVDDIQRLVEVIHRATRDLR